MLGGDERRRTWRLCLARDSDGIRVLGAALRSLHKGRPSHTASRPRRPAFPPYEPSNVPMALDFLRTACVHTPHACWLSYRLCCRFHITHLPLLVTVLLHFLRVSENSFTIYAYIEGLRAMADLGTFNNRRRDWNTLINNSKRK